ncbi:aldo/keto reductase [Subtercola sp. RTI3]|uniref:aldo/keto reductase n=1 Tax=Subtercola sp. RTI3 TaxID=3048639 RepID=UPI002B23A1CE|nr:aldo/keto reductase [Subtercola sp. RTI3]MEA9986695.1 aldo/keto reductase [Subtercola sp. RTI3]
MQSRLLAGRAVSAVLFGGASLSFRTELSEDERRAGLRLALDCGLTFVDTALAYSTADEPHSSERMIGEVLRERGWVGGVAGAGSGAAEPGFAGAAEPGLTVATKGGHYRDGERFPIDNRPEKLERDVHGSLEALGVDRLDLYYLHRHDENVPIEHSIEALAAMQAQGLIHRIGVSNVDLAELRRAQSVAAIAAVQNPLRHAADSGQREVVAAAEAEGLLVLFYSPLSVMNPSANPSSAVDSSAATGAVGFANAPRIRELGERLGATPQQLVLAWALGLSPAAAVVSGAMSATSIRESAAAASLSLSPDDRLSIERALPQ